MRFTAFDGLDGLLRQIVPVDRRTERESALGDQLSLRTQKLPW
ncbi:Uncharacterised protein [Mycobacteroides abscessus subsp. abscessus]|nr:Uncharacterised protein [Mycobacteroides abscessus subsp. abscessus]